MLVKECDMAQFIEQYCDRNEPQTLSIISVDFLPMINMTYGRKVVDDITDFIYKSIVELFGSKVTVHFHNSRFVIVDQNNNQDKIDLIRIKRYFRVELQKFCCYELKLSMVILLSYAQTEILSSDSAYDILCKIDISLTTGHDYDVNSNLYRVSDEQEFKSIMSSAGYIKNALLEDRLQFAFQPIVEIKADTSSIFCYECLLRIQTEQGDLVSAGSYINTCEEIGIIENIDIATLYRVKEHLVGNNITLSFNISSQSIENDRVIQHLYKVAENKSIAERMIIEITETSLNRNLAKMKEFIVHAQKLGCKVAIDDFGAGYTSFKQLKMLPIDILKIDGSIITNINSNLDNNIFVKTIVELTKGRGIITVAEYVEDAETSHVLSKMGVNYLQGYHFSPALNYIPWQMCETT